MFGDVGNSTFQAAGATPTKPTGIGSFAIGRNMNSSSIVAPFGITTLTVSGIVRNNSQVVTDNPGLPTAGFLTAFTAGELNNATVRTGSIGTMKVTGSTPFGRLGNVTSSNISADSTAVTPTGPQAVGALTVAGDFTDSTVDARATVGSVAVTGRASGTNRTRLLVGYATGSKLGSLTAGAWGQPGTSRTTDLSTRSVGTFSLKGNTARGFVGTADRAFIDILGNSAGIGLGTFTATGTISNSLFRVSDGDVTSFTVLRFVGSDLLVGFRPVKGSDLTLAPAAAK